MSEVEQTCDRVAISRRRGGASADHGRSAAAASDRARLTGALPPPPAALAGSLSISNGCPGQVTIDAPGEFAALGLAGHAPLAEVRVEPIGLQSVYDQFHDPYGPSAE